MIRSPNDLLEILMNIICEEEQSAHHSLEDSVPSILLDLDLNP
jgi:hypothetical protein